MVDSTKPIVLIMDGHGSHETLKMEQVAYDVLEKEGIEIIIFCFPSKCTHKMQPLDVIIFNPVQKRWQRITDDCVLQRVTIDRYNVIPLYVKGTREVMTTDLIQKAFEKTGLYPVNRNVFTDEDFAPSQASSTVAHVPPSFPFDVPSSDPIEPDSDCEHTDKNSKDDTDAEDMDFEPQNRSIDSESDSECSSSGHNSDHDSENELNQPSDNDDDDLQPTTSADDIISLNDSDDDAGSTITTSPDGPDTFDNSETLRNGSGLMTTLGRIERRVGLLTRSMAADAESLKPPTIVSLHDDMQLTHEELLTELRRSRQEHLNTYSAYTRAIGALSGAEAHCTIVRREVTNLRVDLDKATKPRTRGLTKTKARFVTSKELYASFEEREAAQVERERIAAEKAKQKAAKSAAECARIAEDAVSRIFSGRVRSYKKGDLQALARALLLSEDGTAEILKERIEEHLAGPEQPQLERNPRFSGLYHKPTQRGRRQVQTPDDSSTSEVVNDFPESSEPQLTQEPSSHPPHRHSPSLLPPFATPQPIYSQPPPFNPYANFPPYQMHYNYPYPYAPAHVHTAGGQSATPNFNPRPPSHPLYNFNP